MCKYFVEMRTESGGWWEIEIYDMGEQLALTSQYLNRPAIISAIMACTSQRLSEKKNAIWSMPV